MDSVNFESIYTWPGICGANTIEINYNYEVPHLKAGIPHFFRLNMGVYGNSSIIKVIIPLTTKTAAIVPHPANWESQLIYQLEPGETADIKLYNNLGTEVYSIQNHPSNSLELKQLNLNESIYYYTVITSSKLFKGKFIYR